MKEPGSIAKPRLSAIGRLNAAKTERQKRRRGAALNFNIIFLIHLIRKDMQQKIQHCA